MDTAASFPSMGATLFFGLTFAALITQGPPDPESNPVVTMGNAPFEAAPDAVARTRQMAWMAPLLSTDPGLILLTSTQPGPPQAAPVLPEAVFPQPLPTPEVQYRLASDPQVQNGDPLALNTIPDDQPVNPPFGSTLGDADPPETALEGSLSIPLAQPDAGISAADAPNGPTHRPLGLQPIAPTATPARLAVGPFPGPTAITRALDIPYAPGPRVKLPAQSVAQPPEPIVASQPQLHTVPRPVLARRAASDLPPAQAVAQTVRYPKPLIAKVTGDRVFLRTAPGRNAAPITQFDSGTVATIWEARGLWRRVSIDEFSGWMFANYLFSSD